jgi:hypothetical protein
MKAVCNNLNPLSPNEPCLFSYNASVTAVITAVAVIENGIASAPIFSGSVLQIDGINFADSAKLLVVLVGNAACEITFCNASQIVCTLGVGTMGTYNVSVLHTQHGFATYAPSVDASLTVGFAVDSITGLTGSMAGGYLFTVTGAGFSTNASENQVMIGEALAKCLSSSPSTLVCLAPPYTHNGTYMFAGMSHQAQGTADVNVTIGIGSYMHGSPYVYDWALTPVVSAASPSLVSSGRTTELTFAVSIPAGVSNSSVQTDKGTDMKVVIAANNCVDPAFQNDGLLHCNFPRGLIPEYTLQVAQVPLVSVSMLDGGHAYAHAEPGVSVQFALRVTDVNPKTASLAGGTILTSKHMPLRHLCQSCCIILLCSS